MKTEIEQSAFVTGAATGIGEALVVRLEREGWRVFAGYRSSPPQQARWFGMPNVIAVPCDVTDPEQVVAAASTARRSTWALVAGVHCALNAPLDPITAVATCVHRIPVGLADSMSIV